MEQTDPPAKVASNDQLGPTVAGHDCPACMYDKCGMCGREFFARHVPTAMPIDDGKLWSWVRSVMAHDADIWQDYERNRSIRYENYSARLDAAAEARTDELKKRLSLVTEDRDHV